jgi:hypothetical protein
MLRSAASFALASGLSLELHPFFNLLSHAAKLERGRDNSIGNKKTDTGVFPDFQTHWGGMEILFPRQVNLATRLQSSTRQPIWRSASTCWVRGNCEPECFTRERDDRAEIVVQMRICD